MGLMRACCVRVAVFAGAVCMGFGAFGQGATGTTVVMPPAPLLPLHFGAYATSRLAAEGVATDASAQAFNAESCAPLPMNPPPNGAPAAGACAAILKEDGVSRFAGATYERAGRAPVEAFAFEFGDATGAYSAYTFLRTKMPGARVSGAEAREGNNAGETTVGAAGSLVWSGTAVLKIEGQVAASEVAGLVAALPKVGGRRGLAPLLPTLLPRSGVEAAGVRYAIGPVGYEAMGGVLPGEGMGWDKSLEAATAGVAGKGGKGTLTLLLYPTPQIAADRGRAIEKMVNDAGPDQLGTVKLRRVGPMVGMTSGGFTGAAAQALVEGLHLNEEVSFDKKMPLEFHAEVRKTASLLQNIAVLCGVLILAAVLLGLFLGGARAGIRVLQGKSAASEPEFLTINLRDEPKPLFPKQRGLGRE